MTTQEIKARLEQLQAVAAIGDVDMAISLETELFEMFIRHVASKPCRLGRKAVLVLKSKDIKFERWCA